MSELQARTSSRRDRGVGIRADSESGLRFLVIDDEDAIRGFLELLLTTEGHAVVVAESGPRALEILAREHVHFVLLDLMMPDQHGISTLERIREARPDVPVILMTGYPETDSAVSAIRLRADDYLRKPFRNEELLAAIDTALVRRGIPRSADEWMRRALGERIRELRFAHRLSQSELAERIGQSTAQISQIERAISTPSLDTCRRIATAFQIPLAELFDGL